MAEEKGRQVVLAARPQGAVRVSDFQVTDFPIPTISHGELLVEVNYLSLDPTCSTGWMSENPMRSQ